MVGTVIKRSWDLVAEHWAAFAGVALIVGAINALIGLLYEIILGDVVSDLDAGQTVSANDLWSALFLPLAGSLLVFAVGLILNAVAIVMTSQIDGGGQANVNAALELTLAKVWRLVGVVLLSSLAIFFGLILLVIPGIWIAIKLSAAIPVVLFEDVGVTESLRRSFDLTKGFWWPIFGVVLILGLTNGVLSITARFPGVVGFFFAVLVGAIMFIAYATVLYFIYAELRHRRDLADSF